MSEHIAGQMSADDFLPLPDVVALRGQELAAEREALDLQLLAYRAEALDELRTRAGANRAAAAALNEAVAAARAAGATWQQIADAAGVTRATAHERWRTR